MNPPDASPSDLTILKQDSRGRVKVPRERQEALVDEFERSGLSGSLSPNSLNVKRLLAVNKP